MTRTRFAFLAAALLCLIHTGAVADAATITTYIYDVGTEVGSGNAMSTDGWTGDDLPNWVASGFNTDVYARNTNDGDNTIRRANDAGFSFTIPSDAVAVSLEIVARAGTQFWQAGLVDGSTTRLGVGSDFSLNDKFFILDEFTRHYQAGTDATADSLKTIRVDYDLVAGTADLVLVGTGTLIDDIALGVTPAELATTDGLFIRSNSRFVGPATFTISVTTVPEPSAWLLGVSGLVGLAVVCRKRWTRR